MRKDIKERSLERSFARPGKSLSSMHCKTLAVSLVLLGGSEPPMLSHRRRSSQVHNTVHCTNNRRSHTDAEDDATSMRIQVVGVCARKRQDEP